MYLCVLNSMHSRLQMCDFTFEKIQILSKNECYRNQNHTGNVKRRKKNNIPSIYGPIRNRYQHEELD